MSTRKTTKSEKKLKLGKDTLRNLTRADMARARGATGPGTVAPPVVTGPPQQGTLPGDCSLANGFTGVDCKGGPTW
jgi:hypothetical protein